MNQCQYWVSQRQFIIGGKPKLDFCLTKQTPNQTSQEKPNPSCPTPRPFLSSTFQSPSKLSLGLIGSIPKYVPSLSLAICFALSAVSPRLAPYPRYAVKMEHGQPREGLLRSTGVGWECMDSTSGREWRAGGSGVWNSTLAGFWGPSEGEAGENLFLSPPLNSHLLHTPSTGSEICITWGQELFSEP